MAKKPTKLTENELQDMIVESVSDTPNGIGYRGAALTHGANYNAQQDYDNTNNPNARSKMSRSREIKLSVINQALIDHFPNIILEFVEYDKNTNEGYGVDLMVKSIKFIDNSRCVIQGGLTVANRPFGTGTVEYQFNTGEFYRVSYSDKTTRSRKLFPLIPHNKETINAVLAFVSNYLKRGL